MGGMDFDDDMQDSDNVDSSSNDSYSEDMGSVGYGYRDDDDDDAGDCGFVDEDSDASDDLPSHRQQNYTILSEMDIQRLQEEDINRLSNLLSVSRSDACILLRHYCWNASKVHDEWFTDEGNVRKVAGLLESPAIMLKAKEINCRICFESCLHDEMHSATCGHKFCRECWRGYIATAVYDGPGCLLLRCPDPSCLAAIGQDMINLLAWDEDKEKYSRYLLRSYIEENKKIKWCPAPGCDFAVNFDAGTNYDVSCRCTHAFCWNCAEDAHRPVLCDTVNKWILKNSAESENMNWILANSKPCPECKRPIEKNHGCMHMTCTVPCKYEFCWLCLGSWKEHGERTGGFYSCNSYETAKKQGVFDEDEMRRERAKSSLEKYTHYYERWATNQSSRKKAQVDLVSTRTEKLVKLSAKLCKPETDLTFITEAWEQIVECRRVLTWTYAYGYYLPECEVAKKQLFEYLQGEAESGLERLHKCAEKELEVFEKKDSLEKDLTETLRDFSAYRTTLVGLTSVTRKYFENLVNCLENGLQEVVAPVSKASKSKKRKGAGSGSQPITYADYVEGDYWQCNICTFMNAPGATVCEMCGPLD